MKFKLGDFVRFVDEKREGYITKIINDELVGVTDDDFEVPVAVSNLTMVHGRSEVREDGTSTRELSTSAFVDKGVTLAVIPDTKLNSVVHFYIVNQSSFQLAITLTTGYQEKKKGEYIGLVDPFSNTKVNTAALTELDRWPTFTFQMLYFTVNDQQLPSPVVFDKKFKAKDFSGGKKDIPQLSQAGWQFQIEKEEVKIDPQKLKESFFKTPEEKREIENPGKEVDLHIEKFRDDHDFLNSSEILKYQLQKFQNSLDAAIAHKIDSIIFIHGAGNGTLRHEIHKIVSKHPQVKTFMDARKEKFGYGATEVVLK